MNIKIVRRPIGEAPEWVRDEWIGLSLPLAAKSEPAWRGIGVLTGSHHWLLQAWALISGRDPKVTGYLVIAKAAVDHLDDSSPNAAAWWREHMPHMLNGSRYFVFDADACERDS